MRIVPRIPTEKIPGTRKVSSNAELRQYLGLQSVFWKENIPKWVRETATLADDEIQRAGNPKFTDTEIDGSTNKARRWSRGHSGSIEQAQTAVRVLYQGNELAQVANGLRPILSDVIAKRFPNSQMRRLQRDWVWFVVRRSAEDEVGNRTRAEYLGGTINVPIGIYDILYLVPEGPDPASYAWFANVLSKRIAPVKGPRIRKSTGLPYKTRSDAAAVPKDRRLGFLGEAVRRMRGRKSAGVVVWGMMVDKGLTTMFSRRMRGRGKLPVIGLAFRRLNNAVGVNS